MEYELEIKDEAKAALRALPRRPPPPDRLPAPRPLRQDLSGDVRKLRGSRNEYRLRVGNHRVLFELIGRRILVYTLGARKDIYQ